jgi:hypothetical protein
MRRRVEALVQLFEVFVLSIACSRELVTCIDDRQLGWWLAQVCNPGNSIKSSLAE